MGSFFLLLLSLLISESFSYKILVFSPAISRSHLISNGRIADTLALAGHDVIILEPDFTDIVNITNTASHARRKPVHGLNNTSFMGESNSRSLDIFQATSLYTDMKKRIAYQIDYTDLCEQVFLRSELIEELKEEKFDAYFGEQNNICGFGIAHILNIKHKFWISSCTIGSQIRLILGMENPTSYLPLATHLDEDSKLLQRAYNLMYYLAENMASCYTNGYITGMLRSHFGSDFPDINDLAASSDIIFVNSEELLDIQTPTLPNIIHIGGLGVKESSDELDDKFSAAMRKGLKGVVLFSLGTMVNTTSLPSKIMESVLKIAQSFPDYQFLIRVDKNDKNTLETAKDIENVLVSDWLPQPAILAHPRLQLFITHAGYNSLLEAARAGVPLLSIPFINDQPRNGRAVASKGWGMTRTKDDLAHHPEKIQEAINEILTNDKYRNTARKLQKLIRSRPTTPAERLVKTTEWVIANEGVPQLKTAGRHLGFIVYYNIDVITVFVVLPITVFIILTTKILCTLTPPGKVKSE